MCSADGTAIVINAFISWISLSLWSLPKVFPTGRSCSIISVTEITFLLGCLTSFFAGSFLCSLLATLLLLYSLLSCGSKTFTKHYLNWSWFANQLTDRSRGGLIILFLMYFYLEMHWNCKDVFLSVCFKMEKKSRLIFCVHFLLHSFHLMQPMRLAKLLGWTEESLDMVHWQNELWNQLYPRISHSQSELLLKS